MGFSAIDLHGILTESAKGKPYISGMEHVSAPLVIVDASQLLHRIPDEVTTGDQLILWFVGYLASIEADYVVVVLDGRKGNNELYPESPDVHTGMPGVRKFTNWMRSRGRERDPLPCEPKDMVWTTDGLPAPVRLLTQYSECHGLMMQFIASHLNSKAQYCTPVNLYVCVPDTCSAATIDNYVFGAPVENPLCPRDKFVQAVRYAIVDQRALRQSEGDLICTELARLLPPKLGIDQKDVILCSSDGDMVMIMLLRGVYIRIVTGLMPKAKGKKRDSDGQEVESDAQSRLLRVVDLSVLERYIPDKPSFVFAMCLIPHDYSPGSPITNPNIARAAVDAKDLASIDYDAKTVTVHGDAVFAFLRRITSKPFKRVWNTKRAKGPDDVKAGVMDSALCCAFWTLVYWSGVHPDPSAVTFNYDVEDAKCMPIHRLVFHPPHDSLDMMSPIFASPSYKGHDVQYRAAEDRIIILDPMAAARQDASNINQMLQTAVGQCTVDVWAEACMRNLIEWLVGQHEESISPGLQVAPEVVERELVSMQFLPNKGRLYLMTRNGANGSFWRAKKEQGMYVVDHTVALDIKDWSVVQHNPETTAALGQILDRPTVRDFLGAVRDAAKHVWLTSDHAKRLLGVLTSAVDLFEE